MCIVRVYESQSGVWERRVVDGGPTHDLRVRILGVGAHFFDDSRRRCGKEWVDRGSKFWFSLTILSFFRGGGLEIRNVIILWSIMYCPFFSTLSLSLLKRALGD